MYTGLEVEFVSLDSKTRRLLRAGPSLAGPNGQSDQSKTGMTLVAHRNFAKSEAVSSVKTSKPLLATDSVVRLLTALRRNL